MIVDADVWLYADVDMGRQGVPSGMRVGTHTDAVGGCPIFTIRSQCQALGRDLVFSRQEETFAKLRGTAIMCLDSQSLKLHFDYRFPPTRE